MALSSLLSRVWLNSCAGFTVPVYISTSMACAMIVMAEAFVLFDTKEMGSNMVWLDHLIQRLIETSTKPPQIDISEDGRLLGIASACNNSLP